MHKKRILFYSYTVFLALSACSIAPSSSGPAKLELLEPATGRHIPLVIHQPRHARCRATCPVAIFGTGYGVPAEAYGEIGETLAAAGYFSVIVQLDLPDDDPMPDTGNITLDRAVFWHRGEKAIETVLAQLPSAFPGNAWHKLILAGHSQGGDIAALYAKGHPEYLQALITLDNRRIPLPRMTPFPVLSLRSSDQPADAGVLPPDSTTTCILRLGPSDFCVGK